jgi:hypothetical protein
LFHYKRKNICPATLEDISIEDLIKSKCVIDNDDTIHKCEWCNKEYNYTSTLVRHEKTCLNKSEQSPPISTDTIKNLQSQIDEIKQLSLVKSKNNAQPSNALTEDLQKRIKDLESINRRLLEKNRNENYYQRIIEIFLGNTHENLHVRGSLMGTTDISTPHLHGEIKTWKKWKYAMGQLIAYNTCDARLESNAYMFGRYEEAHKNEASKIMKSNGVTVYECQDTENGVDIVEYETQNLVYSYNSSDEE